MTAPLDVIYLAANNQTMNVIGRFVNKLEVEIKKRRQNEQLEALQFAYI
jgi:hypothetical protein